MKSVLVLLCSFGLSLVASASQGPVKALDAIDVGRYSGTWYQIARNPVIFEYGCVCSRQILTPDSSGRVAVYNSCNFMKPNGKLREIRGSAEANDSSSNAKLAVSFDIPGTRTALPWKGKYWVIALDSEYRWAVVTDPSRYSLYVLSRTPTLPDDQYKEAVRQASQQVSVAKLGKTQQSGCSYPSTMSEIE